MFTNSRYRMHGVSLHNVCIVYNMNGCVPILYVCFDVYVEHEYKYELMLPLLNMCDLIRVMICVKLLSIT